MLASICLWWMHLKQPRGKDDGIFWAMLSMDCPVFESQCLPQTVIKKMRGMTENVLQLNQEGR